MDEKKETEKNADNGNSKAQKMEKEQEDHNETETKGLVPQMENKVETTGSEKEMENKADVNESVSQQQLVVFESGLPGSGNDMHGLVPSRDVQLILQRYRFLQQEAPLPENPHELLQLHRDHFEFSNTNHWQNHILSGRFAERFFSGSVPKTKHGQTKVKRTPEEKKAFAAERKAALEARLSVSPRVCSCIFGTRSLLFCHMFFYVSLCLEFLFVSACTLIWSALFHAQGVKTPWPHFSRLL